MKIGNYSQSFSSKIIRGSFYRYMAGKVISEDLEDDLFDDPEEREIAKELASSKNERLQIESGELLISESINWATGEGRGLLNAPFAHRHMVACRFSAEGQRVGHFSRTKSVALDEAKHRQALRLLNSEGEPKQQVVIRMVKYSGFSCKAVDITGLKQSLPKVYSPSNFEASVRFAASVREIGSLEGILYDSVRAEKGENLALFDIRYSSACDAGFYRMHWDGQKFAFVEKVEEV